MLQRDTTLESHQAFTLRVDGSKLQLSSAAISQSYIQGLSHGNPLLGEFSLLQSVAYDLRNPGERREVSRLLVGLLRYIDAADYEHA